MICKKCNHKLPDDSEFCQYCGNKVKNVETAESDIASYINMYGVKSSTAENDLMTEENQTLTIKRKKVALNKKHLSIGAFCYLTWLLKQSHLCVPT